MENQTTASKKRKNSEDALNAGFKKALVSSTGGSDVFGNGLGEFNVLENTGVLGNTRAGSESTHTSHHHQQDSDSVAVDNHGSISDLSLNHSTPNSATVDAASAAVMTTMADLLANAGDSSNIMAHSSSQSQQQEQQQQRQNHDIGGVSDEVLRMQQQLQQQIPLSPSTNTRLTREQIIESIANIPDMRLLIEQSLKGNLGNSNRGTDATEEQHQTTGTSHTSALDTGSVLMNLGDPSILATLKPTINLPNPTQTTQDSTHGGSRDKPEKVTNVDNQHSSSGSPGGPIVDQPKSDPGAVSSNNPLHTKWLMATALKEKQIAYKTGTFSSHEDELIRQTIKDYVARNNMPEDAIERWFENGNGRGRFEKNDLKALWVEIAVRLQTRPLLNIYLHVRRMFHPQNNVGAWSKEDDQKLIQLYAKHKGQWTTIGTELGRMADSCRDRYRNHLKDQSTMVTGPWQPHEDEKLLTIMQDLALQQGKANILDSSPMWTLISERMEGTRTRHQCRHRYSQTLQPRLERGEWTAPSSAAAAAAAAVAANAAVAASGKQQQQEQQTLQLHADLGLDMNTNDDHSKTTAAQDVLMLAAALQGVLPTNGNDNMLWTQAMSTNLSGPDSNNLHGGAETHLTGDVHHEDHDDFSAAAFAASLPIPALVPKAPKGPIRRRSGLQQQLDVLRMIQEDGYTDHTDIKWSDIAQRLRDRVEEANAIQLARIIQTHDRLDSKKQQHLQDGDSTAAAAAAASAAMAAAVSAAQAEAVASLQRVPAANQIARTFMSSRCKFEGYKEMTLQQVVIPMMKDVERRIQHRRGASANPQFTDGSMSPIVESAEGGSSSPSVSKTSPSSSSSTRGLVTTSALLQQQEINDAAQQAAIAALSAQFPFLQQHLQQQQQSALAQELSESTSSSSQQHATSSSGALSAEGAGLSAEGHGHPSATDSTAATSSSSTDASASAQAAAASHQQELEQQQHNRDLAEQMLHVAFSTSEMNSMFDSLAALSSATSSSDFSLLDAAKKQKQATRRVLNALRSATDNADFPGDSSEDDDKSVVNDDV